MVSEGETRAAATVLILDGEPVVGWALAALLQSIDYDTRYTDIGFLERPGALDGVGTILLAPPWSSGDRRAVLRVVTETPAATRIQVLEIGVPDDEAEIRPENYIPWPCRTEDLKRRIETALRARSGASGGA